ncbi:glycosyltransferase [Balneola sp. MJW-20]|uniref:glycosyltransferase n=1 Tax=Gracilimonas aurantiaca TaxID=3234185 RepID=UPI0034667C40
MKKALFVLYYVPPMGGSGVQRPLKFMKYLKEYGWEPVVLCPETGAYPYSDASIESEFNALELDVHRVEANTPFHALPGITSKFAQLPDLLARPVRKLNRLFMYPDNKKGWITPAVTKGISVCRDQNIDLIFSSAPPFSDHMIAKLISEETGLPYILDYRDLWMQSHFHQEEYSWQREIRKSMEEDWLSQAKGVVVLDEYASRSIAGSLNSDQNIRVIPHGFDPEDLINKEEATLNPSKYKVDILYSGLFYEANQPDNMLRALAELRGEDPEFPVHLHIQGKMDKRHIALIHELDLVNSVTDHGYLHHAKAASNLLKADVLWVMDGFDPELKQVKSGKLFEYLGTGKPILGISHPGAMQELLHKYGASYIARPDSVSSIKEKLTEIAGDWRDDNFPVADKPFIERFDRKQLAGELAQFFDECIGPVA